jgi:hypothetical protein
MRKLRRDRRPSEPGKLPNQSPQRVWGGWGSGSECAICGKSVSQGQAELELEFLGGDGFTLPTTYIVHADCFAAWDSERKAASSGPALTSACDP